MRAFISVAVALTGLIGPAVAQDAAPRTFVEAVKQVTERPAYAHANWGLEVWSVDQAKPLYAMNGDKLFIPGSTTKLFTEGSALYLLGPDYRFHTPLYRTGRIDKAGVLREVLLGARDPERLPVQLVAPEAGRLVWMLDRTAAAELPADRPV